MGSPAPEFRRQAQCDQSACLREVDRCVSQGCRAIRLNIAQIAQHDLDDLGIAKNAREEKLKARQHKDRADAAPEVNNAEMARLYRQHVLKEQPTLQIQGLGGPKRQPVVQSV